MVSIPMAVPITLHTSRVCLLRHMKMEARNGSVYQKVSSHVRQLMDKPKRTTEFQNNEIEAQFMDREVAGFANDKSVLFAVDEKRIYYQS